VPLSADLREGDEILIGSAGAYTSVYASRFNGFAVPRVVLR
jgi:ornithine decarboxylase